MHDKMYVWCFLNLEQNNYRNARIHSNVEFLSLDDGHFIFENNLTNLTT